MKCYKTFFSKDGLIKNIGSYALLLIILINIVLLIYFLFKESNFVNILISEIIKENIVSKSIKEQTKKNKKKNKILPKRNSMNIRMLQKTKIVKRKNNNKKNNPPKYKKQKQNKGKPKNDNNNSDSSKTNEFIFGKSSKNLGINNKNITVFEKTQNNIKIFSNFKYNDYELDNLNYKDALKIDKRKYLDYYISQLKRKQKLLFTFYTHDDYNSKSLKISILLFSFSLYYTVNALFFMDSSMHDIYVEKGSYNLLYELPQIVYTSFISGVINTIINYFSLSERSILDIKAAKEKNDKNLIQKIYKIENCLNIRFGLYFLFNFLFLIFFWYYLGCFCAVYKNTQNHLIKDTILSFGLSLLYPFGLSLIPGLFRIPALNTPKHDKECFYKFSQIIQMI